MLLLNFYQLQNLVIIHVSDHEHIDLAIIQFLQPISEQVDSREVAKVEAELQGWSGSLLNLTRIEGIAN